MSTASLAPFVFHWLEEAGDGEEAGYSAADIGALVTVNRAVDASLLDAYPNVCFRLLCYSRPRLKRVDFLVVCRCGP